MRRETKAIPVPLTRSEIEEIDWRCRTAATLEDLPAAPPWADLTGGSVIARDLCRYYTVLAEARRGITLTKSEAVMILSLKGEVDQLREASPQAHRFLRCVDDALQAAALEGALPFDAEHLMDRLMGAGLLPALALCDAVEQAWVTRRKNPGVDEVDVLAATGIRILDDEVRIKATKTASLAVSLAAALATEEGGGVFEKVVRRPEYWNTIDHELTRKAAMTAIGDLAIMQDGTAVLLDESRGAWIPRSQGYVRRWLLGEAIL